MEVFSSNYELYAGLSRRVMDCLHTFSPDVEVYSIDEAFLSLSTPRPEDRGLARFHRHAYFASVTGPAARRG